MSFKPGRSGNPSGRPKGVQDRRNIFRDMIEPNASKLIETALTMALSGNESMMKLLLERLLPARPKEDPICIDLQSQSLVEQSKKVLDELRSGKITSSEAKCLMSTISEEAKIFEIEKLKNDVDELKKIVAERYNL